jgi:hypothetical protein
MGYGGEDKAQHAQERCRGVGRDMGQVGFKFGARWQPVTKTRKRKVMVAKREKGERLTRTKKTTKNKKDPPDKKKANKMNLVVARATRPQGCPLDHRYVPIRAVRANFDLLSIHIGSASTIQLKQIIKKRVVQRVVRSYHGTTVFG